MTVRRWGRLAGMVLLVWASAGGPSTAQTPPPATTVVGPIVLRVDVRDTPKRIFHVRETIPVRPGPLTLAYPKWLPGEHEPDGPITDMVGLHITADGRPLEWRRDPLDVFVFHVQVPVGAQTLEASFDFLSALSTTGFSSAASVTAHLGVYSWNQVVLYPVGPASDDITVTASLDLPVGWSFATALTVARQQASTVVFAPVSLTTLVDSPVIAGEHLKTVAVDTSSRPVSVSMVADSSGALDVPAGVVEAWTRLVREADALFGARHFDHYRFLLTLSDRVAHFGLEHHQSNDSRLTADAVVRQSNALDTMAHEYVHSWNGKFRRPAGLATADFQQPMAGDLLWVYEGLTQYLGYVIAVRSGLIDEHRYREGLAAVAATQQQRTGRAWRSLGDTSVSGQILYDAPAEWRATRRGIDFYDEGSARSTTSVDYSTAARAGRPR
jgi:predicted metalloprotease with PDZ domain